MYRRPEKENIWATISQIKNQFNSPNDFAEYLINLYNEKFKGHDAPNRNGPKDIQVRIMGAKQLSKYHDWEDELIFAKIEHQTWRFLEVVAELIRRKMGYGLDSSIFSYFDTKCSHVHEIFDDSEKQNFFLNNIEDKDSNQSGVLHILGREDDYHMRVRLWVSRDDNSSYDQLSNDINEKRYAYLWRWDGLARFSLPKNRQSDDNLLFSNYDVTAIVKEFRNQFPGVLIIKNNVHSNHSGSPLCQFQTPYNKANYGISPISSVDEP